MKNTKLQAAFDHDNYGMYKNISLQTFCTIHFYYCLGSSEVSGLFLCTYLRTSPDCLQFRWSGDCPTPLTILAGSYDCVSMLFYIRPLTTVGAVTGQHCDCFPVDYSIIYANMLEHIKCMFGIKHKVCKT